jgi:hypothetical protein
MHVTPKRLAGDHSRSRRRRVSILHLSGPGFPLRGSSAQIVVVGAAVVVGASVGVRGVSYLRTATTTPDAAVSADKPATSAK